MQTFDIIDRFYSAFRRGVSRKTLPGLVILIVVMFVTTMLLAVPIGLDSGFGVGGITTTDFNSSHDYANDVAIQNDGKIILGGYIDFSLNGTFQDFSLARYDTTGTLDPLFGSGGKVNTEISSDLEHGEALAIQTDGKIILAGTSFDGTNEGFALVRYDTGGIPDPAFGTGGKVTTDFNIDVNGGNAVAIQPDGKIVVAGFTGTAGNTDFALARYDTGGLLDPGFGVGGKVVTTFAAGTLDIALAVLIQSDNKIVAAGYSGNAASHDFALARYNSDGTPDLTFNGTGLVTTPFNFGYNRVYGLVQQPDQKLVAAGVGSNSAGLDFALVRYNTDGSLDTTFDVDGKRLNDVGSNSDFAQALVLQPDNKLLVGGYMPGSVSIDFVLARYNTDGSPDLSFDGDGIVVTDFAGLTDKLIGLALQTDRKIVAAGFTQSAANIDYIVARYNNPITKNLIVNGGFEDTDEDGFPTGWKGKNLTGDKRVVNKPDKTFAHTGNAAFQFKGGAGEHSSLIQKPELTGLLPEVGDEVVIQLYVRAKKVPNDGVIIAILKYADEAEGKIKFGVTIPNGTYDYTVLASTSEAVTAAVQKVKLKISNKTIAGKFWIDDLNLTLVKA
ncbi:MAG TPA: hypothetical protein VHL11_14790, partial [Phototrophicaceae bacterium]|nr:hypothetical protein [Phototrophicaceae bacterium]